MQPKIVARVLSYHKSQRYIIARTLQSAWNDLVKDRSDLSLEIAEVRVVEEILKYTQVIAFASLMIDEKLVCIGRCPKKDEVTGWLRAAIAEMDLSQVEESVSNE